MRATGRFEAVAAAPETAARSRQPDVVVFDAAAVEGPEAVRALASYWSRARVVILGVEADAEVVPWAEVGALGFVGRDASMAALCRIVDAATRGELLCSPGVAAALCARLAALSQLATDTAPDGLTLRERQIALLVEKGLTNKEIAVRLNIQAATVKNHVHSILAKLGVRRRGEAAARLRLMHPDLGGPRVAEHAFGRSPDLARDPVQA